MALKKKYTKDEAKTLALELEAEVLKLKTTLDSLESDLVQLQLGDSNEPYWNGKNAYDFHKSALGNLDHNRNLLTNLEKCSDYLNSTIKK